MHVTSERKLQPKRVQLGHLGKATLFVSRYSSRLFWMASSVS
jgi:hypothetical protein